MRRIRLPLKSVVYPTIIVVLLATIWSLHIVERMDLRRIMDENFIYAIRSSATHHLIESDRVLYFGDPNMESNTLGSDIKWLNVEWFVKNIYELTGDFEHPIAFRITIRDTLGNIVTRSPEHSEYLIMNEVLKPIKASFTDNIEIGFEYQYSLLYMFKKRRVEIASMVIIAIILISILNALHRVERLRRERSRQLYERAVDFSKNIHSPITAIKNVLRSVGCIPSEQLAIYRDESSKEMIKITHLIDQTMLCVICGEEVFAQRRPAKIVDIINLAIDKELKPYSSHNIQVKSKILPDNLAYNIDTYHTMNAIRNIIHNSITCGGDSVTIQINCYVANRNLYISISDNGGGVAETEIMHLFKKGYKGSNTISNHTGAGLGLYYVSMVAKAHNGGVVAINNNNDAGKGLTVTLKFS